MAYDRIDWHEGSDSFPENVAHENAGVHIGIFLAWCIENDLIGDFHLEDEMSQEYIEKVKNREITGTEFLIEMCDEKFWDEDLSDEGNKFAEDYYNGEESDFGELYFEDYAEVFADYDNYMVEDSWENYDKMKPILDKRFREWKEFRKEFRKKFRK